MPREIEVFEVAALQRLVAEGDFRAHRPARGECDALIHRELPLGENIEHFAADIARRSDNCNLVTHVIRFLASGPSPGEPAMVHALGRFLIPAHPPREMRSGERGLKRFWRVCLCVSPKP